MSIARLFTVQPTVTGGHIVSIEADISRGLHAFSIVGLAGKANRVMTIATDHTSKTP